MHGVHYKNLLIYIISGILLLGTSPLFPKSELPEIQQITTHPGADFHPDVSSNGQWLTFVSERSGNLDIWIKKLPHGKAVQITFHPADDTQPAWSPDGKSLAFVSKRRDAMGDIWMIALNADRKTPRGKPKQVTQFLGYESSPSFSPNGKKMVFVSDRDGRDNLWVLNLKSKKSRRLTENSGFDPAWSPDGRWILFTSCQSNPAGDLCVVPEKERHHPIQVVSSGHQGCWSPDGNQIVFLRYDQDTNGDGALTPQDHGTIWQVSWPSHFKSEHAETRPFQITTSQFQDREPHVKDAIYFTSNRSGSEDIWSIPVGGLIPQTGSALDQYGQALDRFSEVVTIEALKHAILAYHRVVDFFPEDSLWSARTWIQIGEIYHLLQQDEQSWSAYDQAIQLAHRHPDEAATARLKQMMLQTGSIEDQIQRCQILISQYQKDPYVLAETWLLLGDLYQEKGDALESLEAYTHLLIAFPQQRNLRAQARLKIGDLFQSQGQLESARQSYMTVLREFGDVPIWRKRGGERLLALVQGSSNRRIQAYRMLIQEMEALPSLVAEAQLSIGRLLIEDGKYYQALNELNQIEKLMPHEPWAHAKAKILQAQIYSLMKEDLRGILLLEQVIAEYHSLEGGQLRIEATEALFSILIRSADELMEMEDYALAYARLGKAMTLHPDDVQVHRQFVESGYRSGKIEPVILFYENEVEKNPNQPEYLYGLGLALSYRGERREEDIYRSNMYLKLALDQNYRLIQPYQTLGYNYELIELKRELEGPPRSNFLTRFGKTLLLPFQWLVGIFRKSGGNQQTGYHELAIEALMTALELNDESTDPKTEATLAQNCANNFYKMGEFGYKKAYTFYQKRLEWDTTFTTPLEKAVFHERAGHCGLAARDFEGAIVHLKTAIRIFYKLDRKSLVAYNWKRLGLLYQIRESYEEAVEAFSHAQTIDELIGSKDDVEKGWRNIAYNYHLMGEPEEALRFAKKAEALLLKREISIQPTQKSKLRAEILGFSIPIWGMDEIGGALSEGFTLADEAAFVYGLISQSAEALKYYPEAIVYEKKRFEIAEKRKDELAKRISINRLGILHFKILDFQQAWDAFYQSWEWNKKKHDRYGRWINAINLGNVACTALVQGVDSPDINMTIQILQEEVKIRKEGLSFSHQRERMVLNQTLGNLWVLKARQNYSNEKQVHNLVSNSLQQIHFFLEAESYLKEALRDASGKYPKDVAVLYKNMSEIYMELREYPQAYASLRKSLGIFQSLGDDENRWRVLYGLAKIRSHLPRDGFPSDTLSSSGYYFLSAIDLLESMATGDIKNDIQFSDQLDRWNLYKDAAMYFLDQGNPERGLEMVERGRQRQAVDWVMQRPPDLKRERHKIIWGNLQYLRSRLYDIQQKLQTPDEIEEGAIQNLEGTKARLSNEYQSLMDSLRGEDPMLAYLLGTASINLSNFQNILKHDEVAISYLVDRDRLCIWILNSDTLQHVIVPVEKDWLTSAIDSLFSAPETPFSQAMKHQLYEILIEPILPFIQNKSTFLIVPDDALWQLPFGILESKMVQFSNFSHSYTPSLMSYLLAFKRRKIGQEKGLWISTSNNQMGVAFDDIVQETQFLGRYEANEDIVLKCLPEANLIHLDRKAVYNSQDPLTSAWMLRPDGHADGLIQSRDIYRLDLKASLLVAPEPVYPTPVSIGSLPFLYALYYAGVPSILMPRWPHSQEIKTLFNSSFYSHLKIHPIYEALQLAKQDVRSQFSQWKDWAGFDLFGYTGLSNEERIIFSRENMIHQVEQGRAYETDKAYTDALRSYETALDMASVLNDSNAIQNVHREIRRVSIKGELWEKTIFYQKKIKEDVEATGDFDAILRSTRNLIAFYMQDKDFKNAAETQKQYIHLIPENNITEKLKAYEQLAFILSTDGQNAKAVAWMDTVLAHHRNQNDSLGIAKAMIRKGRFLLEESAYWDAHDMLHQGVHILKKVMEKKSEQEVSLQTECGAGYQLLGLTCEKLARYQESQQFHEKSLIIYQSLMLKRQEGLSRQYMADVLWKQGKYREALIYQTKAMEVFQELNDQRLLSLSLNTQGLIYKALGDWDKAQASTLEALALTRTLQQKTDEATILKNMGLLAIQQKRYSEARAHFLQAMHIDSSQGYQRGLSYDLRNLGVLNMQTENVHKGIIQLRKGRQLSKILGDKRNELLCDYRLGQAYHMLGENKTAEALLDSGLVLTSQTWNPAITWMVYHKRAHVRSALGRMDDALDDLKKAIHLVETLRSELQIESLQQGFINDKMQLYYDAVHLLIDMGRPEEAFHFVERAKSRSFVDLLANQSVSLPKMQNESLKQIDELRMGIQEAQQRLTGAQKDRRDQMDWDRELQKRREAYEHFLLDLQIQDEELASFISVSPLNVGGIQSLLPDSTVMLAYFLTDEIIYSWVINKEELHGYQTKTPLTQVQKSVKDLREIIQSYLTSYEQSRNLYQWLIQPVEEKLHSANHVIIVPHGILHYLPFSALQDQEENYLIDSFSLSYIPSATVLKYCMDKNLSRDLDSTNPNVLALCNPELGSPSYDLPFAAKEAAALKRTFSNVKSYQGVYATEDVFRKNCEDIQLIHFATHGVYEPKAPLFSALLLSPEKRDDGRLEAHEVFGLTLNCDLVTLSACETGLAHITQGDELVGLSRSFIYAGAPSILTSLWKVDDLATAVFMKRFYRYLKAGHSKPKALQRTQIFMREHVNNHPAAWAAFELTGDFR